MSRALVAGKRNRRKKHEYKKDQKLIKVFYIIIGALFFVNIYASFSINLGLEQEQVSLFAKAIIAFFFIFALPTIFKRVLTSVITIFSIFMFVFLTQLFFFAENTVFFLERVLEFLVLCVPVVLIMLSIRDYKLFFLTGKKFSRALLFLVGIIMTLALSPAPFSFEARYAMGLGYSLVLPVLLLLSSFFEKRKLADFLLMVIGLLFIALYGSRGPFLGIFIFLFFKIYRELAYKFKKNCIGQVLTFALMTIAFISLIFTGLALLSVAQPLLLKLGVDSRTLTLFADDIFYDSGRSEVYQNALNQISSKLIYGNGIAVGGGYPHNIFLELLLNFGIILGSVLILLNVLAFLKTAFNLEKSKKCELNAIFMSSSFVSLMVSGTLWTHMFYWPWIVLTVQQMCKDKKLKSYDVKYCSVN